MDREKPEGYFIPFHQSLINPILSGGIDRNLCIGLWCIGAAIGFMLRMYWFLLVTAAVHMILREATKKDDMFFALLVNHMHCRRYFW